MRIAILGIGHVGLVSGACFASKGHRVTCIDVDPDRVRALEEGRVPFFEPGLAELVAETAPERLRATVEGAGEMAEADVILLAVGTPFGGERIDLDQIRDAARRVGAALRDSRRDYPLVIVKSTVLPGTTDGVVRPILEEESGLRAGVDFGLGMNPEFLREGLAVSDFLTPDRVVMGGLSPRCWTIQEELYRDFPCADVLRTTNSTAEAIKYASNSLLATLISFSNEIGNLCSTLPGVDVTEVMEGVHLDKRLSPIVGDEPPAAGDRLRPGILSYLAAGCGFGGSCLPKDVQALAAFGDDQGSPMGMLRSVLRTNADQPRRVVDLVRKHHPDLGGVKITVLGLSFKPGTSDIRETPALPVIRELHRQGARVRAWDPAAVEPARGALPRSIELTDDLSVAVDGAQVWVVLTAWPELGGLGELAAKADPPPLVVDGRRILDPAAFHRYEGIGRG